MLFQRDGATVGFVHSSCLLSEYLDGLITGKNDNKLDVKKLSTDIVSWDFRQVQLLSVMSMDTMQELYSQFQKYDDRWNEVFMRSLTPELQELKV